jgi:hypothetical protein
MCGKACWEDKFDDYNSHIQKSNNNINVINFFPTEKTYGVTHMYVELNSHEAQENHSFNLKKRQHEGDLPVSVKVLRAN